MFIHYFSLHITKTSPEFLLPENKDYEEAFFKIKTQFKSLQKKFISFFAQKNKINILSTVLSKCIFIYLFFQFQNIVIKDTYIFNHFELFNPSGYTKNTLIKLYIHRTLGIKKNLQSLRGIGKNLTIQSTRSLNKGTRSNNGHL